MRKTIDLADVQIEIPEGPSHEWKRPEPDPSGTKRNNFGDVVKMRHEPTGCEVQIPAREFGAQAVTHGLTDLIHQIAQTAK